MEKIDKVKNLFITSKGLIWYFYYLHKIILVESLTFKVAGTYNKNGQFIVEINKDFVHSSNIHMIAGVILHELLHIILAHMSRRGTRKQQYVWNLACDLEINSIIYKEKLLPLPTSAQYAFLYDLPMGKYAEWYYQALLEIKVKTKSIDYDAHKYWKPLQSSQVANLKNIKNTSMLINMPQILQNYVDVVKTFDSQNILLSLLSAHINKTLINSSRRSYKRLNRYYGENVKGKIKIKLPKIIIAIDTSLSVPDGLYSIFIEEIKKILNIYKSSIKVLLCDNRVVTDINVTNIRRLRLRTGYGGTDYNKVFEYIHKHKYTPDIVFYFTDGEGTFPEKCERTNTIFIVPKNKNKFRQTRYCKCISLLSNVYVNRGGI